MRSNRELLEQVSRLTEQFAGECFFVFFGGFAVDGHCGRFTREHGDIDGICWRENIDTVRGVLGDLGFGSKLYAHPEKPSLVYKLNTTDVDKTFTFQIIDHTPNKTFEISFYRFLERQYPIDFLTVEKGEIESVKFPIVSKEFLLVLKEQEGTFYNQQKIDNPEKYERNIKKHKNVMHDIQLLRESG